MTPREEALGALLEEALKNPRHDFACQVSAHERHWSEVGGGFSRRRGQTKASAHAEAALRGDGHVAQAPPCSCWVSNARRLLKEFGQEPGK